MRNSKNLIQVLVILVMAVFTISTNAQDQTSDAWLDNSLGTNAFGLRINNDGSVTGSASNGRTMFSTNHGNLTIGGNHSGWCHFWITDDIGTQRFLFNRGVVAKGGEIGSYDADLRFTTSTNYYDAATHMVVRQDGRVVIGDVEAVGNYKLYVKDGIMTECVNVAPSGTPKWADYVFEKDYELNSIEKVATFVEENKHLPNVPSAKEVGKKGLNLAEMDATLLRQIEELWLHTIEMNEENKTLKDENETIKEQLIETENVQNKQEKQYELLLEKYTNLLERVEAIETTENK